MTAPLGARVTADSAGRRWWAEHRVTLLRVAIVILTIFALVKLSDSFRQLAFGAPRGWGGIDVRNRHDDVEKWFAGQPIYAMSKKAIYPPASFPIFWLMVGWLDPTHARWLWAAGAAVALVTLTRLLVAESGADTRLERMFVALLPLSMNATGMTIKNGQPIIFLLPLLLVAVRRARRVACGWADDALIAALLLITMVKPTDIVPFFWLVLLAVGRWRSVLVVGAGYLALTLFATSFQSTPLPVLVGQWLARCWETSALGYAHVHVWLEAVGLQRWNLPASLLLLIALGIWTYRHRHADLWILLGVAAFVTRVWTYHQLYDDMLMLLPMIALFRIAHEDAAPFAGVLLLVMAAVMLAPEGMFYARPPLPLVYSLAHTSVWLAVVTFLLARKQVTGEQVATTDKSGLARSRSLP